jgi:hypothetical protein
MIAPQMLRVNLRLAHSIPILQGLAALLRPLHIFLSTLRLHLSPELGIFASSILLCSCSANLWSPGIATRKLLSLGHRFSAALRNHGQIAKAAPRPPR